MIILIFAITSLYAQIYDYQGINNKSGISIKKETLSGLEVSFAINQFTLSDIAIDGKNMKHIEIPGSFLPNDEGSPDLPGFSSYIAIPEGASAEIEIISHRSETIRNVEISPAPRIPLDTEDDPMEYRKNSKIYTSDSYFPAKPFQLSKVTEIRGVDAVMLGITPFQYNPVTKELRVYYDVEIKITFVGGTGHFGDDRKRSPWWDQILSGELLNASSLPKVDYNQTRMAPSDSPDYDYIIITPDLPDFLSWADSIKTFRTLQGIKTGIVTTTEIGGNTVAAIENYVNNAYNNWTVAPSAVLLLGDYSSGSGGITSQTYVHPAGYPDFVSDNRFADVTGNELPDIVFARITANNAAQLEVMITKFLDYERNPPTNPDFYDHPITALGWQTERWFQLCSELVGGYLKKEQGKNPVRINAVYDGNPTSDPWSTAPNTSTVINYFGPNGLDYIPATPGELGGFSGGTATQVVNAINDGSYMLQHRDHGYYGGWGEPAFNTTSISSLHNINNELPFIFSINCQTGAFHRSSESFAEKFHRFTYNGQNSGALGIIAATEVSYSFVNDVYVWGVFDNLHPDFMPGNSAEFPVNFVMPAFGNAAGKHFLYQTNWPYNSGDKQITYRLFHHHGDAFMTLYTEVPEILSVAHNPILYGGTTSFTVTANLGSFIALTVDGEIIGTATGTGSALNIAIPAQAPESEMIVTVTKQNHFRYQSSVEIIAQSGPYVIFDAYEINDYADNNGNGQIDYGETIWLSMTLKNMGTEAASNVSGTISTLDDFTTISNHTAFYGNIAAGAIVTIDDAYVFDVNQDVPDQHEINFLLTTGDETKTSWQSNFSATAHAPAILLNGYTVLDLDGNNNGILDPGETAPVQIQIKNNGGSSAYNVNGLLSTSDTYLTIQTNTAQVFGLINPQQTTSATFTVTADEETPGGHISNAILDVMADFGISQQVDVEFSFADYCYPTANCSYSDGFTGFALNDINNINSGCSLNGFGDFTLMSTELEPGETYTLQWETGYTDQDASMWIDFNNNREFETSERLITDFNLASAGTFYNTNFTLPAEIFPGSKRMRIRANWQNSSSDPCANFTYGETEDYTIIIVIATTPPPVANFEANTTNILEGESVSFVDLSSNNPTSWLWEFSGGSPASSTQQNPAVAYNNAGIYSVKLTASNEAGSDNETKINYITVVSLPQCAGIINPSNAATDVALTSNLQWSPADEAAGYKIYFGTNNPPTNIENGTDLGNNLIYDPTSLTYETEYFWKITAYNQYGDATGCTTWSFTTETEPVLPPPCVSLLAPQNEANDVSISTGLEWSLENEADGYIIFFGTDNPPTNIENGTELGNSGSYSPTENLSYSTTYFWQIVAYNLGGEATGCEIRSFTTEDEPQSQTHFVPVWTSPFNPMNVFALTATVENIDLQPGDEIGLFDVDPVSGSEICVGVSILTETLGGGNYLEIIASMDDGSIPEQANGFTPGNQILYKFWNSELGEIANISANYPHQGYDENYTSQGTAFVELSSSASLMQTIALQTGWNMISFMVEPDNSDMLSLVQPLIDQELFYKILDENGGSVFHLPFPPPYGQWSNTIGDMACTEGYYLKVYDNCEMNTQGSYASLPMQIALVEGWNMISYPCAEPTDAMNVFQPLIDAEVLYKVVDENGGSVFHLPMPPPNGQWSNTIGNFEGGEGYYIKVTADFTLTMNEPSKNSTFNGEIPKISTTYFQPVYQNNPYMPMHIALNTNGLLIEYDEIAVFDGDICVGAQVYTEDAGDFVIIPCAADDPETESIDGYQSGNNISIIAWDNANQVVYESISTIYLSGDQQFNQLGTGIYSLNNLTTGVTNGTEGRISLSIFPNPVKENAIIAFDLLIDGKLNIEICDIFGTQIKHISESEYTTGNYRIDIHTHELNSGYYLIKYSFDADNLSITNYQKFIIIK